MNFRPFFKAALNFGVTNFLSSFYPVKNSVKSFVSIQFTNEILANLTGSYFSEYGYEKVMFSVCVCYIFLAFKAVNNLLPTYLSDLFTIRENIKNLRGTNKLVIPKVNTTRYGTKSVAYTASKASNSLPDTLRCMKTQRF